MADYLKKIFPTKGLSAEELKDRGAWLRGMILGSGMEMKGWVDWFYFNNSLKKKLNYEEEYQRYNCTQEWLVCEEDTEPAYYMNGMKIPA